MTQLVHSPASSHLKKIHVQQCNPKISSIMAQSTVLLGTRCQFCNPPKYAGRFRHRLRLLHSGRSFVSRHIPDYGRQIATKNGTVWHGRFGQSSRRSAGEVYATAEQPAGSLGVVITGGSKGLGFCMACEFLSCGDAVVICGRNSERLEASRKALQERFPKGSVFAIQCDVSKPEDLERLAQFAGENIGTVDRWINNAGEVTQKKLLSDLKPSEISQVVGTNVLGSMLGSAEAVRLMRQQPQSTTPIYHILNLGFSPWGAAFSKSACTHKTTKTALTQLTESLSKELIEEGVTSIGVHNLSPGMVLTDLLLKDASPVGRRFFNALAEEPETVAAVLVPQIRALEGTRQSIEYLNPVTAFGRVVGGVPQILFGGRFFDKEGNRVRQQGENYKENGVRVLYDVEKGEY